MMEISLPRGVKDLSYENAQKKKRIIAVIEDTFKKFGFYPIETPSLENIDVLNAKSSYGDESLKELYTLDGNKIGLRFDFTVPLARYISINKDLHFPFKRYQIGNVWRKEEPQKMRYREFTQADIDIVGSREIISDAEVIAAGTMSLESLGIKNATIYLNSRKIMVKILKQFKVSEENIMKSIRIVDKLNKIGTVPVIDLLVSSGMLKNDAEALIEFITSNTENDDILMRIESNINDVKPDIEDINNLIKLLKIYNFETDIKFDPSLARGLDYYTSFVWEIATKDDFGNRMLTIAGGGRYDNLIGIYSKKEISATGTSIGIDRLMDILPTFTEGNFYKKAFVAYVTSDDMESALAIAMQLRAAGIYIDLNTMQRNLSKQLEHANALKFKYVVIIGKTELDEKRLRIKNLETGTEEMLNLEDAISVLRE
jgi:histidyl-tRNA synthetase